MAKQKKSFGQKIANSKKQIFVGREVQIQKFQQNIKLDPYDDDFLNIINVYGQGGVGKTTLLGKYLSICKSQDYYTAFIDTEDVNYYEITETMNFIANALVQQGANFKKFTKRYKDYLQEKGKLEAAPDRPKGTWGKIVKAGIKVGSKIGAEALPGGRLLFDPLIADSAAETASEWVDFVAKTISNKDEIELILHPIKVLTPLWIEDLEDAYEKKNIALFFDTLEESNPALEKWMFELLKGQYGDIPSLLLIIGGRRPLDPEKWNEFLPFTYKIKLEPFSELEAKNYLEQRGINNPVLVEQLLSISGRLPVYLSLLAEGDPTNPYDLFDPSEKIVERFLRHIDNPVQRDLALHACLPSQLNQDVVECILADQEKVKAKAHFEWLKARPFVEKRNNYWAYHSVVREIMQRHLIEISEKEWESHHTKLVEWYEDKAARLEVKADRDSWFKDENWRMALIEKHFHLLSANYQKNLPGAIQDFVSLLFHSDYAATIPLITILNTVEKVLHIQNGLGEILLKGIAGLMAKEEEGVLTMLRTINQMDCIVRKEEKSFLFNMQGGHEPVYDQAIASYQKALEFKPDYQEAFDNMGIIYYHSGDFDQAIASYQKALEFNSDYHEAFIKIGLAYSRKGDFDKEIASYQKALEIKPDEYLVFIPMGIAFYNKGDYERAIAYFQKALEIKPDYFEALHGMGIVYYCKGDVDQAIAYFQKALEIKPDYLETFYYIGIAYSNKGDYDQAIAYFQKALEIKPDYIEAFYDIGIVYSSKGDYDQAIASFQKTLEINPELYQAFYNIGVAYSKKRDYDQTIASYQKALEIKSDYQEALYYMGNAYGNKGDYDQAIASYQKALEINPDYQEVYYYMGVSYEKKRDFEKAIASYQKALEIKPDDQKSLYSLGWANLFLLRFEHAKRYLHQVWDLSNQTHPYAAMDLGHVALLYEKERTVALMWYKKSIALRNDLNALLKGIESDFSDLQMEKQGISREFFNQILDELN